MEASIYPRRNGYAFRARNRLYISLLVWFFVCFYVNFCIQTNTHFFLYVRFFVCYAFVLRVSSPIARIFRSTKLVKCEFAGFPQLPRPLQLTLRHAGFHTDDNTTVRITELSDLRFRNRLSYSEYVLLRLFLNINVHWRTYLHLINGHLHRSHLDLRTGIHFWNMDT